MTDERAIAGIIRMAAAVDGQPETAFAVEIEHNERANPDVRWGARVRCANRYVTRRGPTLDLALGELWRRVAQDAAERQTDITRAIAGEERPK